ncbi:MAG: hypothetical protein ACWA5K_06310 [bacterium]
MSYLLTALRKADQERADRNAGEALPGLANMQQANQERAEESRPDITDNREFGLSSDSNSTGKDKTKWLVAGIIVLLVAVSGYLYLSGGAELPEQPQNAISSGESPKQATAEKEGEAAREESALAEQSAGAISEKIVNLPVESQSGGLEYRPYREERPESPDVHLSEKTAVPSEKTAVVQPPEVAKRPDLNITGYIYFQNRPEISKVYIDGLSYRQGDSLPGGAKISGFSATHLIVTSGGREFHIPAQ